MSAGDLYSNPKNLVDQNLTIARGYYEKACEMDLSKCDKAATLYTKGLGMQRNFDKAKALYTKACENGNIEACNALNQNSKYHFALSFINGEGVKQDLIEGMRLLGEVCDSNDVEAVSACVMTGDIYQNPKSQIGQDFAKAKIYFEKACLLDASKCDRAAFLYARGKGAPKNLSKAGELYAKACENGNIEACNGYRDIALYSNLNIKNATCDDVAKLGAACRFEAIEACNKLGLMYSDGICRQNLDMARAWYGKSCDLLDEKGCKEFKRINEFLLQLEIGASKTKENKK